MAKAPKRVRYGSVDDLVAAVEDVRFDKEPRILERDGEAVAVVVSAEEYAATTDPKSRTSKARLLALAGVWKDLDTDKMVEEIYRARHGSPPSVPVDL